MSDKQLSLSISYQFVIFRHNESRVQSLYTIFLLFGKAYSTFTAIFNWLLQAVCVILAETLDFLIMQNWLHNFTKVGLSLISLLPLIWLIF